MKALKWINTGAFAAMVCVNALANMLPIGGNTTAQISQATPTLFTPAPVTFAIWGLIYLLMALFVLYQWEIFDHGTHSAAIRESVGIWFAVSCALNILWIFLWHYRMIGFSMIAIVGLLLVLLKICNRVSKAQGNFWQRMSAKAGFSLYFGWIIAATIANCSVMLVRSGWNGWGFSEDFWTVMALLAGTAIACALALIRNDRIAALAVMWAYMGILIRHISPVYYAAAHPVVIAVAAACEAVIMIAVLIPWFEKCACCRRERVEEAPVLPEDEVEE